MKMFELPLNLLGVYPCSFQLKPVLVQIMALRLIGGKAVSEPMLAKFTDAYFLIIRPLRVDRALIVNSIINSSLGLFLFAKNC